MNSAGGRGARTRQVYILAGEFSAPRDAQPVKVFRPFKDRAGLGSLDEMMFAACERAIHSLGGASAAARITHLLGITFPGEQFFSTDVLNRFYDLKRRLGIHERCQVRFEIGSSDAGAVLFASALHQLRGSTVRARRSSRRGSTSTPTPTRSTWWRTWSSARSASSG